MKYPRTYLLQYALKEKGFYTGELDGDEGPETIKAFEAWLKNTSSAPTTFEALVTSWGLNYFTASELLTKGGSNGRLQLNTDPPASMWPAIKDTALAADEARRRLGSGIIISSAYRSPAYNKAIGGASKSYHTQFRALDMTPTKVSVASLHSVLRKMRSEGWKGCTGIGRYTTFCHIDNGPTRDF